MAERKRDLAPRTTRVEYEIVTKRVVYDILDDGPGNDPDT